MIVVDASVMVSALLVGGSAASRLLGEDLHAPHLVDAEVASAVRGQVLGGRVDPEVARVAVASLAALSVDRHEHPPLLGRVWELRHNVTAYDGMYIALAEALSATLVTGDAALATCPGLRTTVEVIAL